MKILHIYDHTEPLQSGYVFRSRTLRTAQIQAGHECDILSMPRHFAEGNGQSFKKPKEEISGQIYFRTKPLGFKIPFVSDLIDVFRAAHYIGRLIKKYEYDVVHAHSPIFCGLAAWLAVKMSKALNVLVVYEIRAFWEDAGVDQGTVTQNNLKYKLIRNIETFVCHKVDKVYPICVPLKKDLVARGIPENKITVIPNVVTENAFQQHKNLEKIAALKQQYNINQEHVLGFIGSFYAYEGLEDLLPIILEMRKNDFPIKLLLVGGGDVTKSLKEFVRVNHMDDDVIFTGRIDHGDVYDHYQLCHAMIYPRRSMRLTETVTPLKPLEAAAAGIPVILSDIGGHRELLEDKKTGFFIKNFKDIQKTTSEIQDILTDTQRLAEIAEHAFIDIKATRLPQEIIKKYYQ